MADKILKGWQLFKLGDVVNKINDKIELSDRNKFKRYVAGEHIDSGEIRITKSAPIEGNEEVIGSAFHMRFKPGHVLYVTRRAYLRKAGIVDFEGICSNVSFILEAKKERLLQTLLPYILQTEDFVNHAISSSHGSTNPFLNWKDIASFEFLLPSKENQEKISEILWKLEENIERCSKLLEKKNILFNKIMKRKLFSEKSQLIAASTFLKLQYGQGLTEKDRRLGKIPVIGSTGITGYHDSKLINGPAVIIGRKGNAGNVIYIEEDCYPIDTTYYLEIDSKKILLKYAYYLLKFADLHQHVEVTAVPGLNRNYVHNIKLSLPDKKNQQIIVELFDKLEVNLELTKDNLSNLKSLRQKLMNELLLGRIRLK